MSYILTIKISHWFYNTLSKHLDLFLWCLLTSWFMFSYLSLQGTSWVHIPTELPFTSISVGSKYRVWATATDGSVWVRHGTSADNPLGMSAILLCSISMSSLIYMWFEQLMQLAWHMTLQNSFCSYLFHSPYFLVYNLQLIKHLTFCNIF